MTPEQLQTLLDTGASDGASSLDRRIADARRHMLENEGDGWADLVILVRQALERWALAEERGNRACAVVRVSATRPWPSREQWERAGVVADTVAPDRLRLQCRPWQSAWLSEQDARVVEDAITAQRRQARSLIAADPLIAHRMGLEHARSAGQRDAIRSVHLTPAGSNVLVVLPTGAGKSAVFQFAALHNHATGAGMVVVVVPTIALARDQERRYRELVRQRGQDLPAGVPLAFHSGLSDDERIVLRRAVASGELPILFASPESLLGTLQSPLLVAAEKGLLSVFAVDEAHMVAQWAEFRPRFQAISGFRDALAARCPEGHPFRTVLLTATLTKEGFHVLTNVFGSLLVVAEVALRPEPGYLIARCADEAEKCAKIDEALYRLPRPLIVYTTLRRDAEALYTRMTQYLGFRRVRCVRGGDMSDARGEEILRGWSVGEIDVIVATSAFGLGVDQSEVRSVLHACVPESIDRWYQEVGRAGRDGCASVALLVADAKDEQTAERMAYDRLLLPEKAWSRWGTMRRAPRPAELNDNASNESHTISVPLDTLAEGNDVATTRDEDWSFRTLTMMVHAGMLRFSHAVHRPSSGVGGDAEREDAQGAARMPYAHVTITHTDHLDKDRFSERFSRARAQRVAADEQEVTRLRALIEGTRSVHDLLRETYAIPAAKVTVPKTAGDCPKSRREGRRRNEHGLPILVRPADAAVNDVDEIVVRLFRELPRDYHGPLLVRYEPISSWSFDDDLNELVGRLAALGFVEFAWPDGFGPLDWARLGARAPARYVFAADSDDPSIRPWKVPRLSVLRAPDSAELVRTLQLVRPRHVVLVPEGLRDPHAPHRAFNARTHMDMPTFLTRIRPR
ncbi:protein DpdF [Polyangium sp. 6x1]|uniref:protein DpdF n=1 Tax=Polyangium sp. 6x1 TaxID=3042689 RepID=UPI00248247D1|nr:protein DpdF [Polyangium sp. 6x1]MDI1450817.1 protein DpdF [Polyangium sp. 6x1]